MLRLPAVVYIVQDPQTLDTVFRRNWDSGGFIVWAIYKNRLLVQLPSGIPPTIIEHPEFVCRDGQPKDIGTYLSRRPCRLEAKTEGRPRTPPPEQSSGSPPAGPWYRSSADSSPLTHTK